MKDGGTPLHWATSKEIINAMVELGCIVNARNFHGLTALHKMVRESFENGETFIVFGLYLIIDSI